jgi:hypothetical protein
MAVDSRQKGSAGSPPEANEVLEEIERILASRDFDASPRSRSFLRHIVEETLAGHQEGLTQAAIATSDARPQPGLPRLPRMDRLDHDDARRVGSRPGPGATGALPQSARHHDIRSLIEDKA